MVRCAWMSFVPNCTRSRRARRAEEQIARAVVFDRGRRLVRRRRIAQTCTVLVAAVGLGAGSGVVASRPWTRSADDRLDAALERVARERVLHDFSSRDRGSDDRRWVSRPARNRRTRDDHGTGAVHPCADPGRRRLLVLDGARRCRRLVVRHRDPHRRRNERARRPYRPPVPADRRDLRPVRRRRARRRG